MNKVIDIKSFIIKANEIHNNYYDYSMSIYVKSDIKLKIICPVHGIFEQIPNSHLSGRGCIHCGFKKTIIKQTDTTESFIIKANEIHNNIYTYDNIEYIKSNKKINITCKKHGGFLQTPNDHLTGYGCPQCGIEKNTESRKIKYSNKFIIKGNEKHNNQYNYSLVEYINDSTPVKIICSVHGEFLQKPRDHKAGKGCKKCGKQTSNKEINWLDWYNVPKENRQIELKINNINYKLDGINHETNTIYEFWGDYYHGNPTVYEKCYRNKLLKEYAHELYSKTMKKRNDILNSGYNLIEIWEHDYDKIIKMYINQKRSHNPF